MLYRYNVIDKIGAPLNNVKEVNVIPF